MTTSDDLIAMYKATEQVLENMARLDHFPRGDAHLIDAQLASLRGGVQALATVQRDLLKAMLGR